MASRSGITAAWAVGIGIVTWRSVSRQHHAPFPGQLLAVSGLFALLGVIADYEPAAGTATLIAWGVDVAALLQVLPGTKLPNAPEPAPAPKTGTHPKA
jgi:hypothetical protein